MKSAQKLPRAEWAKCIWRRIRSSIARKGKLWEKIKDLHERVGYFDDAHVALATATRHFGNVGAHPKGDLLEDLTDDEARRALDLGLDLIRKMYS